MRCAVAAEGRRLLRFLLLWLGAVPARTGRTIWWQAGWMLRQLKFESPTPMSAMGVRRGKAALSSGCKSHPATAPAGSSRSSYGGDEIAEAFGKRVTNWWQRECAGRNASERRASLEKDDAQADPTTLSGKADTAGRKSEDDAHPLRRGSGDSMV